MTETESVKLIEVFNTWQGEGPDSGKAMTILRFKTCNLNCPWCDTRVKMRITPEAEYPLSQLQEILRENGAGILVTGGEPTAPRHFNDCLNIINRLNYPIANVESNGFKLVDLIEQTDVAKKVNFMFSPKIFNQNDFEDAMFITKELFPRFKDVVSVKVVYEPDNKSLISYLDWLYGSKLVSGQSVYLMPEGTTRATLIQNSEKVFDAAEKYNFNFSSRDHIIYGFV